MVFAGKFFSERSLVLVAIANSLLEILERALQFCGRIAATLASRVDQSGARSEDEHDARHHAPEGENSNQDGLSNEEKEECSEADDEQ